MLPQTYQTAVCSTVYEILIAKHNYGKFSWGTFVNESYVNAADVLKLDQAVMAFVTQEMSLTVKPYAAAKNFLAQRPFRASRKERRITLHWRA